VNGTQARILELRAELQRALKELHVLKAQLKEIARQLEELAES
jgi:hypothetical protein